MQLVGGLDLILLDHFKPYRVQGNANRFDRTHTILVAILPAIVALAAGWWGCKFIASNAGGIVAVYAVMASVMTAIMPTINGLIGPVDQGRIEKLKSGSPTSDSNIEQATVMVAKVEIVRGLYAAVAWSVILLCVSLLPCLIISHSVFQEDIKSATANIGNALIVWRIVLAAMITFAGCTSLVALLQIVTGIHLMLRHNQVDIEKDLMELNKKYKL